MYCSILEEEVDRKEVLPKGNYELQHLLRLYNAIESKRIELYQASTIYGLNSTIVLGLSEDLDILLNEYSKANAWVYKFY